MKQMSIFSLIIVAGLFFSPSGLTKGISSHQREKNSIFLDDRETITPLSGYPGEERRIPEYPFNETMSGNSLLVSPVFKTIIGNYGFEIVANDSLTNLTGITSKAMLLSDRNMERMRIGFKLPF